MKNLPNTMSTVHLDAVGEISHSRWVGQFTVKCILSHADKFAKARLYAALMPERENLVEEEDRLRAAVIAELSVRISDGPEWWSATHGGQLMADLDPLVELLKLCQEESIKWSKKLEEIASFGDGNVVTAPAPSKS
jgi:hypothetical protein